MSYQKNNETVENEIIKKYEKKDERSRPRMKVAGKEVLKLKKIISEK